MAPTKEEKATGGFSGVMDRLFEWKRFFKEEVLNHNTLRPTSPWDYLGYSGTVLAALLLLQFATGIFLLLYYRPGVGRAFYSVEVIRNEVPFGFLYQSIHSIGSRLIILVAFIHMFRIMLISGHRGPREKQWYLGVLLLGALLGAGFSGYLLPWSQQSYWASVIGTEAMRAMPVIGDAVVWILRGGRKVSGATLGRFFAFHVSLIPITVIVLSWFHIKKVWKTGVIAPPDMFAWCDIETCIGCVKCERVCPFGAIKMVERQKKFPAINVDKCNACRACVDVCPVDCLDLRSGERAASWEPIFPHNVFHRLFAVLAVLTVFIGSVYFLHGILMSAKQPANPLLTPDRIKPDWYFLGAYQVLRTMPNELLGLVTVFGAYFVVLGLPLIDRSGPRDPSKRKVYIFMVAGGIISFFILTVIGWLA